MDVRDEDADQPPVLGRGGGCLRYPLDGKRSSCARQRLFTRQGVNNRVCGMWSRSTSVSPEGRVPIAAAGTELRSGSI
jgi:hypothetical protein